MTNNIAKIRAALEYAMSAARLLVLPGLHRDAEAGLAALAELEKAATEPAGKVGDGFVTWSANKCPPIGSDLYTTPPPAKPAPQFVAGEVDDAMCERVWLAKFPGYESADPLQCAITRNWLLAWRSELGHALGLVEIREPTQDECVRICNDALEQSDGVNADALGRTMFDAVSKWLKGEL